MSAEEKLRDEIIEFQKQRANLQVWKIAAIGVVGSVALGLKSKDNAHEWLLGLLPVIVAYIDLHLRQLDIRIALIGKFIRSRCAGVFRDYEIAIESDEVDRIGPWALGDFATIAGSLVVSLFVLVYGVLNGQSVATILGILGFLAALGIHIWYVRKHLAISAYSFQDSKDPSPNNGMQRTHENAGR